MNAYKFALSPSLRRAEQLDPEASPARKAILVLGMHRSGTSALTRVLGFCGAALPRRNLGDSHESNPLGHWEPQRIVDAHDRFLEEAGTAWDAVTGFPDAMFTTELAETCRQQLIDIVASEYGNSRLFVLKDPRTSRLLPLWRPVLDRIHAAPHAIIVVRNPLEVASSLQRRDGWDEYRALVVWLRYLLSAERETRDMPRCFVKYDDLMENWRAVVRNISAHLDLPLTIGNADIDRQVDRFVRQDLKHHQRPTAELLYRGDIADCVKQAYSCFSSAAETGTVDYAALNAIAEALDGAERVFKRMRSIGAKASLRTISVGATPPERRDALLALVLAEFGRATDVAERSERVLKQVLSSRSWRFTRMFRAFGRAVERLIHPPVRLSGRS
jgi:hypothetical protein